ncbi:MAG: DUF6776 family protein [Pseudomonadota bacterium]|nr:DUF6776 family protein [Pseudomonadota bacterium]
MKLDRLVVISRAPWQQRQLIVVGLALLLVIWGMYELGQWRAGYHKLESIQLRLELNRQIDKLTSENQALGEQVTMLERTRLVDDESADEVRNTLVQLQNEVLELREEVDFYRGIISPADRQAGLDIQSFKLSSGGEKGLYHYDLVMTQVLLNQRIVSGSVKVFVQGVQDGVPVTLDFKKLSPNNSVTEAFKFRYFQALAGDIRLPEGFVARAVQVEITSGGSNSMNKSFPWAVQG